MGSAVWQEIYFHHFNCACISSHLSIIVALMLQQGPSSRLQWTSLQVIDRHNCNQLTETFSLHLQLTFKVLGTSNQSYLLPIRLKSLTRTNILVRSFWSELCTRENQMDRNRIKIPFRPFPWKYKNCVEIGRPRRMFVQEVELISEHWTVKTGLGAIISWWHQTRLVLNQHCWCCWCWRCC